MFGKSLATFLLVLAFHYPLNTALTVSASLAQNGEFTFILARLGLALGVLIQAHVTRVQILVIATPDAIRARKMIEIARALNPRIHIVARCHSEDEAALLRREHAVEVRVGEQELANSMVRQVSERADAHAATGN